MPDRSALPELGRLRRKGTDRQQICPGPSAPDTSEPVAGADWTTWGIINDQKTLIQMGAEKEVYVCTYDDRVDLNETVGGSAPTLYTQLTYPKRWNPRRRRMRASPLWIGTAMDRAMPR